MIEEFIQNFHFLRPWYLLLLVLPIFVFLRYFRGLGAQSSWQKIIDKRLLDYLLIKGSAAKRRIFIYTGLIGIIIAIISVAGPTFQKIEIPALEVENPTMLLLNLSSDMKETDLRPNRLSRAKYKIEDFLKMLKSVQAGLIVYTDEPYMISPLTDDMNILQNLLPAIDLDIMPSNGDRLDRAIDMAVEKIKSAGYANGQLIIFAPDVGQNFDWALAAAKKAKSQGFAINIIGTTAKPSEKLALVAKTGGGNYWNLQSDDAKIASLAKLINKPEGDMKKSKNTRNIWLDIGWYLLSLPMLCCLMFFRRGLLVVFFVVISTDAYAGFFLNSNQEALRLFNSEQYDKASQKFTDNNWKAASLYRLGDYQKASKLYQNDNSVTGLYNQGNALAKSGNIKEAIAKYEEVLKQAPNHEDAKFNLEYLKQNQQQNQQQNQNSSQQNQNDKQDQQDNNNQQNSQSNQDTQGNQNSENEQQSDAEASDKNQSQNSSENEQNADKNSQSYQNLLDEQTQQNFEQQTSSGAKLDQGEKDEQYEEQVQAKMQQYRDIPEDPGGLLKALIYQQYRQNRYNQQ